MNEQDEDRLDNFLRDKLGSYRPAPSPAVWESVERRLSEPTPPPAPESPRFNRIFSVVIAGLLGVLIGWWLNQSGTPARQATQSTITQQTLTIEPTPSTNAAATPAALPTAPQGSLAPGVSYTAGTGVKLVTPKAQPLAATPSRYESAPVVYPSTAAAPVRVLPNTTVAPTANAGNGVASTSNTGSTTASSAGAGGGGHASHVTSLPVAATASVLSSGSIPHLALAALTDLVAQETVVQTTVGDSAADSRTQLRAALLAEKAELVQLHHRADSLLRALEPLNTIALSTGTATSAAEPDATQPVIRITTLPKPRFTHRWALALAFTPERTFLGLQAPAADTLMRLRRNHESGRAGLNATVMGEYRVSDRFSVGMGVGYSRYGAELRLTDRRTDFHVRYDTTTVTSITNGTSSHTIVAIREDSVAQLTPRFNASGQVAYYDTVYVYVQHADSITLTTNDQVTSVTQTIKPNVTPHDVVTYRVLRPTYHFVTLPLLVRYRLTANNRRARCWADVAVGAQVQLFRGGSQLVTTDGRTYHTERVGANEGPFRPVNVALTGQFALNYALSPRLSANLAPAVRWQMQSVYKRETGLRQQPLSTGVQLGLRWTL
jgi:hypothetical protein